jgi:hypothetical protein
MELSILDVLFDQVVDRNASPMEISGRYRRLFYVALLWLSHEVDVTALFLV